MHRYLNIVIGDAFKEGAEVIFVFNDQAMHKRTDKFCIERPGIKCCMPPPCMISIVNLITIMPGMQITLVTAS
jgi:hypothetical protein